MGNISLHSDFDTHSKGKGGEKQREEPVRLECKVIKKVLTLR